jgi:hypothetical protein
MNWMPQLSAEHRKLHTLAGTWSGDETLSPSQWGPGGTARGSMSMALCCDGFFVSQDYAEEKDGKTVYRGHGVFGWDDKAKEYTWYWVDSMGSPASQASRGTWDGDTLVFQSEMGPARGRYTFRFENADQMHFRIENAMDGKTWQTFMEGRYRRQAAA